MFYERLGDVKTKLAVGYLAVGFLLISSALAWLGFIRPIYFIISSSPLSIMALLIFVNPQSALLKGSIVSLGNLTYSSYLLQFPVQLSIVLTLGMTPFKFPFYSDAMFVVFIAITLLMAYVCYYWFEHPAQRLLRAYFNVARDDTAGGRSAIIDAA